MREKSKYAPNEAAKEPKKKDIKKNKPGANSSKNKNSNPKINHNKHTIMLIFPHICAVFLYKWLDPLITIVAI